MRGNWTQRNIAIERQREAAREELQHGFRGPMSDDDMVRYAAALTLVHGPAAASTEPDEVWETGAAS